MPPSCERLRRHCAIFCTVYGYRLFEVLRPGDSQVEGYSVEVREAELWTRMAKVLPDGYSRVWADQVVLADLSGRTVSEALEAAVPCKTIWRAVWRHLELPGRMQ